MKKLSECTVLIVDDTEANVDILVEALGDEYELAVAMDGQAALEIVELELPDIILLDIMMPEIDGYDVCRCLKQNSSTADIPVIFLTAMADIESKAKGFELGAVDYVTKPFEILEVRARVNTHLSLKLVKHELAQQNEILEEKVIERTKEICLTQETTIEALACLAEYRDPETGGHIQRTKNYVKVLAQKLMSNSRFSNMLNSQVVELMYKSAPLHDIGKIGISDDVLLKRGKLTEAEFEEMKKHTIIGHSALKMSSQKLGSNSFLKYAMEFAKSHQEKWDGSGYPDGLAGDKIPLAGRIMAVADVYDALISKRVYKPPLTHKQAVEVILEGKGQHFDPDIVDAFMELQEAFRQIALKYVDYEEERLALSYPVETQENLKENEKTTGK